MGVRKILDIERDLERFIDMRNHRYFKRHKEHQINLDGQTMRGLYDSMGLGPRVLPAEVEQYRIAGTLPGISRARQLDERAGRFIIESEATDDSNGVFGRPEFRYLHVVTVPFDKTLLVAAYVARSVAKNTGYLWMKKHLISFESLVCQHQVQLQQQYPWVAVWIVITSVIGYTRMYTHTHTHTHTHTRMHTHLVQFNVFRL